MHRLRDLVRSWSHDACAVLSWLQGAQTVAQAHQLGVARRASHDAWELRRRAFHRVVSRWATNAFRIRHSELRRQAARRSVVAWWMTLYCTRLVRVVNTWQLRAHEVTQVMFVACEAAKSAQASLKMASRIFLRSMIQILSRQHYLATLQVVKQWHRNWKQHMAMQALNQLGM